MGNPTDIAAVIFDLDGLLIDSEPLWWQAERLVMQSLYGLALSDETLRRFQGASNRAFCQGMAKKYADHQVDADLVMDALLRHMADAILQAPLMPGGPELMSWFAERQVPLAIASSSPLPFIEGVIRQHRLPVRTVASGTEVPRSKPHPAVFELAAERLGVSPESCQVWEDSVNGVIAAKAAGMRVVAVPDPHHPTPAQFSIADAVHRSLFESLEALQNR